MYINSQFKTLDLNQSVVLVYCAQLSCATSECLCTSECTLATFKCTPVTVQWEILTFFMLSSQTVKIQPVIFKAIQHLVKDSETICQNTFRQIFEKSVSVKISCYTVYPWNEVYATIPYGLCTLMSFFDLKCENIRSLYVTIHQHECTKSTGVKEYLGQIHKCTA